MANANVMFYIHTRRLLCVGYCPQKSATMSASEYQNLLQEENEIDSHGDVVLIMRKPRTSSKNSSKKSSKKQSRDQSKESFKESSEDSSKESTKDSSKDWPFSVIEPKGTGNKPEDTIRYIVSSKILDFVARQCGKRIEGIHSSHKNRRTITMIHTWDPEAFLYVLLILHHRNHSVPKTVSTSLLAKIACIVQFYKWSEITSVHEKRWYDHIRKDDVNRQWDQDLLLQIYLTWIYSDKNMYETFTTCAIMTLDTDKSIDCPGLPELINIMSKFS